MPGKTTNYAIVTPCKDEEWNLPNLIKSVLAQTIRPVLWIIVNDGSTDKSGEILDQLEKGHDWVKTIHLEENKEYLGSHIAYVYNTGFEFIKNYSVECSINWEYIAVLDSDTIAEPGYFEKLIKKFEENQKLGIASGITCEITENLLCGSKDLNVDFTAPEFWVTYPFSQRENEVRKDLPIGSARIWRRECFEETDGGYNNTPMPDAISTVKAKIKGWDTKRFTNINIIERKGATAQGSWYGYKERGSANYVIALSSHVVVLKALNYTIHRPYYTGIAYLWGYIESMINKEGRIEDEEIRKYYITTHSDIRKKNYEEAFRRKFLRK